MTGRVQLAINVDDLDESNTGRPLARCLLVGRVLFQRPPVRTTRASFPARSSPATMP